MPHMLHAVPVSAALDGAHQGIAELRGGLMALRRVPVERLSNHGSDGSRDVRGDVAKLSERSSQNLIALVRFRDPVVDGILATQEIESRSREGVDVGRRRATGSNLDHLGGHGAVGPFRWRCASRVEEVTEAQIAEDCGVTLHQDIARFHVPMNHPRPMDAVEAGCDLLHEMRRLRGRQPVWRGKRGQIAATDDRSDDEPEIAVDHHIGVHHGQQEP